MQRALPWALPIAALLLWQFAADAGWITRRTLPSPISVIRAAVALAASGELWQDTLISCQRAALGFLIGGSLGFVAGLLNGLSRLSEQVLDTSLQMLRNIPHLAIIPMVIPWFGIGESAKVFLVAIGVFVSAWRLRAHCLGGRGCCCWTSRSVRSTR